MFISKQEKKLIYEGCDSLQNQIDALARFVRSESNNMNLARISSLEKRVYELETQTKTKKADTAKYYWRNKAERLANGSTERVYKPRKKKESNVSENTNNPSV